MSSLDLLTISGIKAQMIKTNFSINFANFSVLQAVDMDERNKS